MSEYRTLNTLAYDHLKEMIYSGELSFNAIYSETKLAAQLSISRTPIRDALNRMKYSQAKEYYIRTTVAPEDQARLQKELTMKHKVRLTVIDKKLYPKLQAQYCINPNSGACPCYNVGDVARIVEAYHVRLMIEGYCGASVARHFPRDPKAVSTISRMEDALERQHALVDDSAHYSLNRFWLDDLDFHKALLEYMNISALNLQYESFMHIFMPHYLVMDDAPDSAGEKVLARHRTTLVEHYEIIEALKSHDGDRVQAAIRAHLDSGLKASSVRILD